MQVWKLREKSKIFQFKNKLMGLIIAPFFLLAITLVIINSYLINRLHEKEQLNNRIFLYGVLITTFIYGMILLSYFLEGSIYGLSPYFRIPIFMIILPSFIGLLGTNTQNRSFKTLTESFLASTLVSTILILILNYHLIILIHSISTDIHY